MSIITSQRPGPARLSVPDVAAAGRGFGRVGSAPDAARAASAATDRVSAILGSPEAVGREAQAKHLASGTAIPAAQAIEILKTGSRGTALAAAMGGAASARAALGLPPDIARDAAVARGVEAFLGSCGGRDDPAPAEGSDDAEYQAGAAAARRLLGR